MPFSPCMATVSFADPRLGQQIMLSRTVIAKAKILGLGEMKRGMLRPKIRIWTVIGTWDDSHFGSVGVAINRIYRIGPISDPLAKSVPRPRSCGNLQI